MRTQPLFFTTAILLALSGLLLLRRGKAAGKEAEVRAKFEAADADKNGQLNAAEAKPYVALLAGADADGSGELSWQEVWSHLRKVQSPKVAESLTPASPAALAPYFSARENQTPQVLRAGDAGVGCRIPDLAMVGLDGSSSSLSKAMGPQGLVVAWLSPSCPVGKRLLPELRRQEKEWRAKGFGFVFPAPAEGDSTADLKGTELSGTIFRDVNQLWQQALQARMTTDVFVLDTASTVVYHGAISDQYGVGYSKPEPTKRYLQDALQSLSEGQKPLIAATSVPGCVLEKPPVATASNAAVTYHRDVARLTQQHCVECHREGGVAPFSLETFSQVSAKAKTMLSVLQDGTMPPWFAAHAPAGEKSPWLNDRSLTASEIQLLSRWIEAGKPEGDAKEAPASRNWPQGWRIGEPDAVWTLPTPQPVKAEGTMSYLKVKVETQLAEDRWIQAWEVRPTARQVVHHVLVYELAPRQTKVRDESGNHLASYVPGGGSNVYAPGVAKRLKAGTTLVFELHYTPNGKATEDQTSIGVRFANAAPQYEVKVAAAGNHKIAIPPHSENHAEVAALPVPKAVQLLSMNPHMHVRGKAFRFELILPGGETKTLLDVPRYDFNWQTGYRYAEPPTLPAGSRIKCTAWYDNSSKNPANPAPDKLVKWGPQTSDEMMLGYVEYLETL
jgi:mono/diheme cytochrome c family protein